MGFLLEFGFHQYLLFQLQYDNVEMMIKIWAMDDKIIFIIGFVIFCLYLVGFLAVIYTQNKIQDKELENDPEIEGN